MKTRKQKEKEIILGIIASYCLWLVGMLMSGMLAGGDFLKMYDTGYLVFLFPVIAGGAFVLAASKCAKDKRAFYLAFVISFFAAFLFWGGQVLVGLLGYVFTDNEVWDFIIRALVTLNWIGLMPSMSVFGKVTDCIPSSIMFGEGYLSVLIMIAFCLPAVIGLICSVIIYREKRKDN